MPRCVQSAPAAPLTPAPHILQRRFDQRRESECAPCYLAGSRPWTRHMIAECRAFGGGGVAPRARRSDYYWLPEESQLWWRGQVFTSSPPQGSLSDPAPTPSTCYHLLTLNSQHSGCQRCSHLTAACKYGSDAPR